MKLTILLALTCYVQTDECKKQEQAREKWIEAECRNAPDPIGCTINLRYGQPRAPATVQDIYDELVKQRRK